MSSIYTETKALSLDAVVKPGVEGREVDMTVALTDNQVLSMEEMVRGNPMPDAVKAPQSSGVPSPPSSGSGTPRLTIGPCPLRLQSLIPPMNYGTVDIHTVYRSSFPQERNLDFMKTLKIKTVLTLVDTEPSGGVSQWIRDHRIYHKTIQIATNKDGRVKTTTDSVCEALMLIIDAASHPLHIHCNQGKHRTGCIVGCLRRVQGWPFDEIVKEYQIYAGAKARQGDIDLIRGFDPDDLFNFAKRMGIMESREGKARGLEGVCNVDELVAALAVMKPRADSAVTVVSNNGSRGSVA